jgi:hypothetical protein
LDEKIGQFGEAGVSHVFCNVVSCTFHSTLANSWLDNNRNDGRHLRQKDVRGGIFLPA